MADARQREFLDMLEPVYDRLSRYALAVTRDEMDGEDLVSATVLAAYEQFDAATEYGQFLHYLITIASRLHKRRRYRERHQVLYNEQKALQLRDENPSPDNAAEIRIVMDALATLPEKMRETLVLFEVSDFSIEEIRKVQGGTTSGVKSRLKRGRAQLAAALGVQAAPFRDESATRVDPKRDIDELNAPFMLQESYVQ
jgi:RNA polymerase sigma-70 factor (ECF subfamily)